MRIITTAVLLVLVAGSGSAIDCTIDPTTGLPSTPIVINFEMAPYRLTGAESPVTFDFFGNGKPFKMGWTAAEADEAFLCLDRNYNGTIDNGTELFGNAARLLDGTRADNGFDALLEFDDNDDSVIDERDLIWRDLLLWRDLNHDAVSQSDEITRIEGSAVVRIGLNYHQSRRVDRSGNELRYQSTVWIVGPNGHYLPRPVYDVFFVRVP